MLCTHSVQSMHLKRQGFSHKGNHEKPTQRKPNQFSVDNGTIKRHHDWICLSHCSLGCIFRVKWAAVKPPVIPSFWKAVCSRAWAGPSSLAWSLPLLRPPPCVQHQNHTPSRGRKPSASAVIVSDGNTPGRWRKCRRECVTSNHRQLSERPPEFRPLSQALGGSSGGEQNRGILRKPFHLKISIPCIFSLFFMRARKIPPHICFPVNVTNLFSD